MIYIGIDPSLTGTGIVVLDEQGNVLDKGVIRTSPREPIEARLEDIILGVRDMINGNSNADEECHICLEGLSYGSKSSSMLDLAGLHHVLRHQIMYSWGGIPRTIVPPQTLKKWVCGKGNVKKEQMLLQTYKRWGLEFQDNNICDAYCLARYAMENSQ